MSVYETESREFIRWLLNQGPTAWRTFQESNEAGKALAREMFEKEKA